MAQTNPVPTPRDAAQAYKWLAIFVGLVAQSGSTINQRIEMGYEFKVRRICATRFQLDAAAGFPYMQNVLNCCRVACLFRSKKLVVSPTMR